MKKLIIGGERNPFDPHVFQHLSLIAFFAWVGLGADGLSSSCYGPEEAFRALHAYPALTIFVALASAITVLIISTSYSQIIELFPSGGGGYLVASKLLSPTAGMVSGCALLLDYVLTVTLSIASGADALYSFLPDQFQSTKLLFMFGGLAVLTLMNLRGVKESVVPLVPIFLVFVLTHLVVIVTAVFARAGNLPHVVHVTGSEVHKAYSNLGLFALLFLILRAYSMGAGTYTGIEAVSNGLPILREPRVVTGKRTMRYMAFSLAFMAFGLMMAYMLYDLGPVVRDQYNNDRLVQIEETITTKHLKVTNPARYAALMAQKAQLSQTITTTRAAELDNLSGKTLNAILFDRFTAAWPDFGKWAFVFITLLSEAALLFVAAQAGFIDGPRVLSYMALDGWIPHRFAHLSDRLVTHNGVMLMALAAAGLLFLTRGSVGFLVVLYSINVFITFTLSQTGMVRHWFQCRAAEPHWRKGLILNGTGLILCVFILISTVVIKFTEGGWLTITLTGCLVITVLLIRRHYRHTHKLLTRLDGLVQAAESAPPMLADGQPKEQPDPQSKTAVLLVNGFNGLGLHTLLNVVRLFPGMFKNFVFVSVGVVDVGNFKGAAELGRLTEHTGTELARYVAFARRQGFYAESSASVGTDVVDEVAEMAPRILDKFPNAVFFGGQLVFPKETSFTRLLHNNTVFSIQRRLYNMGVPVIVLPIRV